MSSIARYKNHEVEILDRFDCAGVQLVAIKAIDGEPFVGGDKWPVRTAFLTVQADELSEPAATTQTEPTLFEMALDAIQRHGRWRSGDVERLWAGAIVAESRGHLKLIVNTQGFSKAIKLAFLDPGSGTWKPCQTRAQDYQRLAQAYKSHNGGTR